MIAPSRYPSGLWVEAPEADDQLWELGVSEESDGSLEATALSENENRVWRLFPVQFTPSGEAVARFLEHRKIQPSAEEREQVYADAARPRRVVGVLPLDDDGTPRHRPEDGSTPPCPLDITLPFGSPYQRRLAVEHLTEWTQGDRGQSMAARYRRPGSWTYWLAFSAGPPLRSRSLPPPRLLFQPRIAITRCARP